MLPAHRPVLHTRQPIPHTRRLVRRAPRPAPHTRRYTRARLLCLESLAPSLLAAAMLAAAALCPPALAQPGPAMPLGPLGGQGLAVVVDPADDQTVLVSSWSDGLLRSTDGGLTLVPFGSGLPPAATVDTIAQDPNDPAGLWAVVGGQAAYHSPDFGATWSPAGLTTSGLRHIAAAPGTGVLLANDISRVFHSADGGTSWTEVFTETVLTNVTFAPSDPSVAYLSTINGVFRSPDGGITWANPGSTTTWSKWVTVDPSDANTIYSGTTTGVLASTDGGVTFTNQSTGLPSTSVQFLEFNRDASELWCGNLQGTWFTTNGGASWTAANQGVVEGMIPQEIDFASSGDAYLTSDKGFFRTSGGTSWTQLGFASVSLFDAAIAAPGGYRMASDPLGVYATPAGGTLTPTKFWINGIGFSTEQVVADPTDPTRWLAAGVGAFIDNAQVRVLTNNGQDFQLAYDQSGAGTTQNLAFDPGDPSIVLASISPASFGNAGILRSTDGGNTWTALAATANANTRHVAFDPHVPGRALALRNTGNVLESLDDGSTWALVATWPVAGTVAFFAFDPFDPQVLFLGETGAGLSRSDDGGTTWTPLGVSLHSRSDLALHPHQPGLLFVSNGSGGVRLSADRGASWTMLFTTPKGSNASGIALDTSSGNLVAATMGDSAWEIPGASPYRRIGAGTAGTGGFVPRHFAAGGIPSAGNGSFSLEGDRLLGGSTAFLFLGLSEVAIPSLGGGTLYAGPPLVVSPPLGTGGQAGSGGTGSVSVPLPIPPNPNVAGLELVSQLLVSDPGAPSLVAWSAGFATTIWP